MQIVELVKKFNENVDYDLRIDFVVRPLFDCRFVYQDVF